jgi:hypothetical protein
MDMLLRYSFRQWVVMFRTALLASLITLAGCSSSQVFPTLQEQVLSLRAGDLDASGIAFITPSATTGQEEEKQAVALVFAKVLKQTRPQLRVVTLSETLSAVNKAGIGDVYKRMYDEYRDTGLFKRDTLKQVSDLTGARFVAHLKLQAFGQGAKERFGILGFRIAETRTANVRLFVQIWDSRDGTVAWEALQEMLYSHERFNEEPVTLSKILTEIAESIVARLP